MPSPSVSSVIAVEEVQRLLDHAVHDLRAVLRRIGTSIEIFGDRSPRESVYPPILEGVAHGTEILSAIGIYSAAIGTPHYSFRPLNISIPVNAALSRLEARIQAAGARFECGPLPEIVGDRERLTDLFEILFSNALSYRSIEPPQVEIRARLESGEWIVSVRDNGIGIAPKYQPELFRPFYRLHGSEIPGVGLGLATCRKILEAHQGRIWIESASAAGATVLFTLPA
jgi:light-regulated signal transduction histidine kinase (bacteriophytochrome)